jgi:hypothetical protein
MLSRTCVLMLRWLPTLFIPETFAPVILKRRAQRLRKDTQDDSYCTEQEVHRRPLSEIVVETLIRPFRKLDASC